ncbi:DUF456 domain-containing protein [Gallalistipes aquisgranensis]|uniref:DUF456 domain-containing protein n=1 Tax=Gallalistipes aquisgranensis TaxID=2779358 RepID=UPI001CF8A4DA|nr:DUF456 domain-containing protein [Gallalistipes aquisgranensis]MBE5034437.1 DUF456 domain-containing protein [Gallalistipes aquisgranensis]
MDTLLIILAVLCAVTGIAGSILPVLPGPPVSYVGLLLVHWAGRGEFSTQFLLTWLVVTAAVTLIDYLIPPYLTRLTGGSKAAARWSLAGMLAGIFIVPPVGMIGGMFLGALLGELYSHRAENRDLWKALKVAFGSLLGFVLGTGIKLVSAGFMFYYVIAALW